MQELFWLKKKYLKIQPNFFSFFLSKTFIFNTFKIAKLIVF